LLELPPQFSIAISSMELMKIYLKPISSANYNMKLGTKQKAKQNLKNKLLIGGHWKSLNVWI
jgi:hypothetical protein